MADQYPSEGSSSNISGESSDAIVEINVKTLDSQIYSFQVDKNVSKVLITLPVSSHCSSFIVYLVLVILMLLHNHLQIMSSSSCLKLQIHYANLFFFFG